MHSRHDGSGKRPFTGKEDKRNCFLGPAKGGRQVPIRRDQATHTCPGALLLAVPALHQHLQRTTGKQKVGKGHGTHPQVPEYPVSVPWPVARSQNWAKLLLTSILDVLNVKEIWININLLSKFKVSTPAQSDGKENLFSLEISTPFWWYICMPKVRVQRQFEKIKEPKQKGNTFTFPCIYWWWKYILFKEYALFKSRWQNPF